MPEERNKQRHRVEMVEDLVEDRQVARQRGIDNAQASRVPRGCAGNPASNSNAPENIVASKRHAAKNAEQCSDHFLPGLV